MNKISVFSDNEGLNTSLKNLLRGSFACAERAGSKEEKEKAKEAHVEKLCQSLG